MNKQKNHRRLKTEPKRPHLVLFFVLTLFFAVVALFSLRQNNLTAIRLHQELITVDQQNGDIEAALRRLRQYVYGHMNTNLAGGANAIKPPIQLKSRYERLVQSEKDRVSLANKKIYEEGQAYCEARFPQGTLLSGRVPCVQEYIGSRNITEQPIPEDLYKFDFVSPSWSPDLAGWSLVLTAVFGTVFLGQLALALWLKSRLNQ